MKKISIGIVDDDKLIVELLSYYLLREEDFVDILFTHDNALSCLEELRNHDNIPEILLLDLNMKEMDGIELTQIIKQEFPSIRIIVVSSHYKRSFMGFMLKTGVSAFIPKGGSPQELLEIIKEVHTKGYYFMENQLDAIRDHLSSKAPKPILDNKKLLSPREEEILKLICFQKTAKEIGASLHITPRTVEGHKNNLFAKTGAKNIAGLVIYAIQNEIIELKDLPNF